MIHSPAHRQKHTYVRNISCSFNLRLRAFLTRPCNSRLKFDSGDQVNIRQYVYLSASDMRSRTSGDNSVHGDTNHQTTGLQELLPVVDQQCTTPHFHEV